MGLTDARLNNLVAGLKPYAEGEIESSARLVEAIRDAPLPRLPGDPDPDEMENAA